MTFFKLTLKLRSKHESSLLSRGSFLALVFVAGSVQIGFGLFEPYLPLYAQFLGAVGFGVAFVTSALMATRCAMAPFLGFFSDRFGRKKMILIGLFSYVIICFVFGFVTDWVQLVVLRAVQGVASGSVWPVAIALIADLIPPEKRGSALGIYQAVGMGAYVSGPAVGGAILHYSRVYLGAGIIQSYQIPFYICGALSLVSVLLVSVFVKENFVQKQPNNNSFLTVLSSVPTKFRTTLYTVFVQAFSGGFSMGLIMSLTTIYVKDIFFSGCAQDEAYNLTTSWTASLFLAAGIAIVTSQLIAGKLSDMNGRKPLVVVGGVLSRFCIVAMAFSPNLWFLFLFGVL